MIRIFSAVVYAAACWGSSLRVADANRLFTLTNSFYYLFLHLCFPECSSKLCWSMRMSHESKWKCRHCFLVCKLMFFSQVSKSPARWIMESTLHTEQSDNVPQHQLYRLSQSRSYVYLESVFSGSSPGWIFLCLGSSWLPAHFSRHTCIPSRGNQVPIIKDFLSLPDCLLSSSGTLAPWITSLWLGSLMLLCWLLTLFFLCPQFTLALVKNISLSCLTYWIPQHWPSPPCTRLRYFHLLSVILPALLDSSNCNWISF